MKKYLLLFLLIICTVSCEKKDTSETVSDSSASESNYIDILCDSDDISRYAYELTDSFLADNFQADDYRYYSRKGYYDIEISQIIDGDFKWKYGAENDIYLKYSVCDTEHVKEFVSKLAKFAYEHRMNGKYTIHIMAYFPDTECHLYDKEVKAYVGYYWFKFNPDKDRVWTNSKFYDTYENGEVMLEPNLSTDYPLDYIEITNDFSVEDFFL